jgi:multicomponent Na+:H+ antiporter subunit G
MSLVGLLLDVSSVALLFVGLAFLAGGTLGLVRLPDVFSRAHAASKCDSVGAGSILLAMALQRGLEFGDLKVVLLMLLILVSAPTTAHALARAGFRTGLKPWTQGREERS